MANTPPETVESLLRELLQQVSLIQELQPGLPLVTVPLHWVQGWQRMATTALRLVLLGRGAP